VVDASAGVEVCEPVATVDAEPVATVDAEAADPGRR
jgi:hypothetical protein